MAHWVRCCTRIFITPATGDSRPRPFLHPSPQSSSMAPDALRRLTLTLLSALLSCQYTSALFSVSSSGPLQQCSEVDLFWTEEPPIQLWVAPDRQIAPGDPTLETLGPIDDTFLRWTVDLPVGQNISFTYIRLADQFTLFSSPEEYTIVAGASSACLAGLGSAGRDASSSTTSSLSTSTPTIPSQSSIPLPSSTEGDASGTHPHVMPPDSTSSPRSQSQTSSSTSSSPTSPSSTQASSHAQTPAAPISSTNATTAIEPPQQSAPPPAESPAPSTGRSPQWIVGVVLGTIAGVLIVGALAMCVALVRSRGRRRRGLEFRSTLPNLMEG
ncbi:hypothetical protein C8Q76DRAFT_728673 [Earliella scabrosa]|nr:hypothetical protein C8Q76DRAFT_728673 [Earliella scabrosa]